MDYSQVRGFNIHGDWGANGQTQWLNFDAKRYQEMVETARRRFPGMNTVRIWLSFDAYVIDREKYLAAVKTATDILTQAGLNIIPVYYNGWFGLPCYGAFTRENVQESQWPIYVRCAKDTALMLKDANVLLHDISNEPFNNAWGTQDEFDIVLRFLEKMVETVRSVDDRPITIGSQGYPNAQNRERCDIDRLMPLVDVFSLHPYNIQGLSQEDFERQVRDVVEYLRTFGKPFLITESMWGAPTAEGRRPYLESEFETYRKLGIGFLCHALFTCPVADLYPVEELGLENGLYMAFLDRELRIRPYHDIFNRYS